jgi:molybdenum cofactor cytidylyltransferase
VLPVVIVLAAGRGERFVASGGRTHKLDALLAGKAVRQHVLDAVQASGLPFHVVRPEHLSEASGMGDSIAAGVKATADAPGWLILPADLPLIQSQTLQRIASAPNCEVVVPTYAGQRGHPVRFAASCRDELLFLKGNQGAAQVIRARAAINSVAFMAIEDEGCVVDVDTLSDLVHAEALWSRRSAQVKG